MGSGLDVSDSERADESLSRFPVVSCCAYSGGERKESHRSHSKRNSESGALVNKYAFRLAGHYEITNFQVRPTLRPSFFLAGGGNRLRRILEITELFRIVSPHDSSCQEQFWTTRSRNKPRLLSAEKHTHDLPERDGDHAAAALYALQACFDS